MRTISSFINVSLDGYFEGPNHDISFFKGDQEDNTYFSEQSSRGATILMGHRTYDPGWNNVTVISGDVAARIRALKQASDEPIVTLGSNALSVTLLQEGLIDEFRIMVTPVALGAGTPLFTGARGHTEFALDSTRQFESGKVLLTYKPKTARAANQETGARRCGRLLRRSPLVIDSSTCVRAADLG